MYTMEAFYEGINVTNAVEANEDELIISLQTEEQNKLVIVNIDTKEEKIIIEPESATYFLDMVKIPSSTESQDYFLFHTAKGLQIVNPNKRKSYDLAQNSLSNFNVCKSLQI